MIAVALDLILVMVAVEAVTFTVHHRRTGRGVAPRQIVPNLFAGFCLVLTARLCLPAAAPAPAAQVAAGAVLFAALLAHIVDLAARWRD